MHIPIYSLVTLFTELIITAIVYYSIYSGYKHNRFPEKLSAFALLYEAIFNVSYMIYRSPQHTGKREPAPIIALAAFHGILSIVMFVALIIFFIAAWRSYRKEHNFFHRHKRWTLTFLLFWSVSIFSGIAFFAVEYLV